MSTYRPPLADMEFALFDVLGYEKHCSTFGEDPLDREMTMTLLGEFGKLCEEVVAPLNRSGDEEGCTLRDGSVHTPAGFDEAYQQYIAGGWFSLPCDPTYGGQGLPASLGKISAELLSTANMGFALYTSATPGAITTLSTYGTPQQRALYESRLISGEWNSTMCLTEPHCGTDLGMLRTKADPQADGSYRITGTKIFITGGDHELTPNIVHLVLARLPDAPAGTKGISLFIVPKVLCEDEGSLGERNGVSCGAIEKKMGVKASATCVMNFDGAVGHLLGEPNRGLNAMFTFINASRISAALQGVAHAELGYQKSLAYAKERLQMRSLSGPKNPDGPADPIIVHPDVRRMLLTQKAFAEGNRLLNYYLAMQLDIAKEGQDENSRRTAVRRLDLLTPIAKAFATECGVESANLAIQCFGGHGYIREWGVEQNLRDARIATIYEGTTGVQALDLLGRKVLAGHGPVLGELLDEIDAFANTVIAQATDYSSWGKQLTALTNDWRLLTQTIGARAAANAEEVGAASVSYLMFAGYTLLAYLWARSAVAATELSKLENGDSNFINGKLATARFYFDHLLPRIEGYKASIENGAGSMMEMGIEAF